jgi:hypothetical protein
MYKKCQLFSIQPSSQTCWGMGIVYILLSHLIIIWKVLRTSQFSSMVRQHLIRVVNWQLAIGHIYVYSCVSAVPDNSQPTHCLPWTVSLHANATLALSVGYGHVLQDYFQLIDQPTIQYYVPQLCKLNHKKMLQWQQIWTQCNIWKCWE